jgi:hypothetical protein
MLREFGAQLQKGDNPGAWTCVVMGDVPELFGTRGLVKIRGAISSHSRRRSFQSLAFRAQSAFPARSYVMPVVWREQHSQVDGRKTTSMLSAAYVCAARRSALRSW